MRTTKTRKAEVVQVYKYILDITGYYEHVTEFHMEMMRITKFNSSANILWPSRYPLEACKGRPTAVQIVT